MRSEEDQKIMSSGEMWEQFRETLFYSELKKMILEKQEELKQGIIDNAISEKYEQAKASAWVLQGLNILDEFMDGGISARREVIESEKENKQYESNIRKHVR